MRNLKKVLCGTLATAMIFGLAACSPSAPAASSAAATDANAIDKAAFDELLSKGAVATDDEINANKWAKAIKDAGVLKVGGTKTSYLFSQLDETDSHVRGFDSGLYQLLARYILGDESKYELTQVDSSTRESVLTGGQVNAVFATYSITDKRKEVISFAGPYYTSQQAILVKKGNTAIKSIADLKGKTVATQKGSTGPDILAKEAPEAKVEIFQNDQEARTALEQGRVDAYVTDYTLMLNAVVKNAGKYEIVGEAFGPKDDYGIGLPKDSDGVKFVNEFLKKIVADGTWAKLWQISLGDRTGIKEVPKAPTVE